MALDPDVPAFKNETSFHHRYRSVVLLHGVGLQPAGDRGCGHW